ncbi:hypothetical protein D9M68_889190 [compost metagenome]
MQADGRVHLGSGHPELLQLHCAVVGRVSATMAVEVAFEHLAERATVDALGGAIGRFSGVSVRFAHRGKAASGFLLVGQCPCRA